MHDSSSVGHDFDQIKGAREARSRKTGLKVLRSLRLCSGCGLLKNLGRLAGFRAAKKDERRIRTGLQTAICVIDVVVGLSQTGCYPRDSAGSVWKFGLDHFFLDVRQPVVVL